VVTTAEVAGNSSSTTRTRSKPAQASRWRLNSPTRTSITSKHDKYGDSFDTNSLVGEANIHCGATTRIPINVPTGRDGIMLDATTADTSERALFDAFIVTRGSNQ